MPHSDYWWTTAKSDPDRVAGAIFASVSRLNSDQHAGQDRADIEYYHNLFNSEPAIESAMSSAVMPPRLVVQGGRLHYNLGRSIIQAFVARIGSQPIRPRFLTSGGSYTDRTNGRQLTYYSSGLMYASNYSRVQNRVVRDGCISGDGWVGVGMNWTGTDVSTERVHPMCVYVDGHRYGSPHTWCRVHYASKSALAKSHPKYRQAIMESAGQLGFERLRDLDPDAVVLIEGWHPDPQGGRHVIACSRTTILDRPWVDCKGKPFERPGVIGWQFAPPTEGARGQGIYPDIADIVEEVNICLRKMQEGMNLSSTHILLNSASGLTPQQINNCPHSVWSYNGAGTEPTVIQIPGISSEQIQWMQLLTDQAYERTGMSQLWATSAKPPQLNSGKALDSYNDINSDRFKDSMKAVERLVCDVAAAQVDAAREIYEVQGKYQVKLPLYDSTTDIDWGDINLDRDRYIVKPFAVNLLSEEPAGLLQEAVDLTMQDPAMGMYLLEMLDYPDIAAVVAKKLVDQRLVDKLIEMAHRGKRLPPPDQDMGEEFIGYAVAQFRRAYLETFLSEESDQVQNALTQWIMQAQGVLDAMQPAPAPALPPDAGMVPPGLEPPMGAPPEAMGAPVDPGLPPDMGVM